MDKLGPAIQNTTLTEQISDWLADQIITGAFKPGQQINEKELADRLGTSRSPLREALRILEKEGLVVLDPRRSVMVSRLDAADCSDLYACRSMLEGFCVRLATTAIGAEQVAALDEIFAQMDAAAKRDDLEAYQRLNEAFHMALYDFCPNRTVRDLIRLLWRKTMRYRALLLDHRGQMKVSVRTHGKLMAAIRKGDAEAAEKHLHKLLADGLQTINRQLEAEASAGAAEGEA